MADRSELILLEFLAAKGLDDADRLQTLLHDGDDIALIAAHLVRRVLHLAVEARDEQQQKRCHADSDKREIPIEPEHDSQHPYDGQQVDQDTERSRRSETLDGLDVRGQRGQDWSRLVGVVVAQRQALQVVVYTHAQVVRDPLADTLGVVVVDVARQSPHQCYHQHGRPRDGGEFHLVTAQVDEAQRVKPTGGLVAPDHVVKDDLERPRPGQRHRCLNQHGRQDDHYPAVIGPQEILHQAELVAGGSLSAGGRRAVSGRRR